MAEEIAKEEKKAIAERPQSGQMDAVWLAEKSVYQGLKFENLDEAQKFITSIIESKWWQQRVPLIRNAKLTLQEKGKRKLEVMRHGFIIMLKIPEFALRELVIISSLVKVTVPKEYAWEGKEYTKFMLKMTKRFMGDIAWEDLKKAYVKHNIKYVVKPVKEKVAKTV